MHNFLSCLDDLKALTSALESIQLKPREKADLGKLYSMPDGVPVSRDSGNRVRGETVYSCSRIGKYLTISFGGIRPGDLMMWVGYLNVQSDQSERWVMRPQFCSAINNLGWFPKAAALDIP